MNKRNELYELIWTSRPLMQAAEEIVERGLVGTGLTVRMRSVLEILFIHGELTVPEIAERLHIKRQYVQVMVNETIASGTTDRVKNPRHKRSYHITLTKSGRDVISQVMLNERKLLEEISTNLNEKDVTAALLLVKHLIKELQIKSRE